MDHVAERHLQKARAERPERVDVGGAFEPVAALAGLRVQQLTRGERALYRRKAAQDAETTPR